jgi:DNA-binding MarR family transcriptional regulator
MARTASAIEHLPCVAGTLRRASRAVARLYDMHLAAAGLTTTQLSILRMLQRHGGTVPLAALADTLVFERTSLHRALGPLRRARLVTLASREDRRATNVVLTARARRRIATALPYWAAAQRAVLGQFGATAWRVLAVDLGRITTQARVAHSK